MAGKGGSDSRVTGAGIGLTHEITTVSSLAFDSSVATQANEDNPDEPDIDRTELTAVYIHSLTETVSAHIGYRFRSRQQDPEDATEQRVFLISAGPSRPVSETEGSPDRVDFRPRLSPSRKGCRLRATADRLQATSSLGSKCISTSG